MAVQVGGQQAAHEKTARITRPRPPVDIVIPFRGQYESLTRCYSAIMNYTPNQTFRVFLVDDDSPSPGFLTDFLRDRKKTFGTRTPAHVGFGAAVNAGIRLGTSPLVCVLHSDVYPENIYWLYHLQEALGIGRTSGVKFVSARLTDPGTAADYPPELIYPGPADDSDTLVVCAKPVPWTCCLFNRELFNRVGPLKEYPVAWYEDVEYANRMARRGFRQGIATRSVVRHGGGKTINALVTDDPRAQEIMSENARACHLDVKL